MHQEVQLLQFPWKISDFLWLIQVEGSDRFCVSQHQSVPLPESHERQPHKHLCLSCRMEGERQEAAVMHSWLRINLPGRQGTPQAARQLPPFGIAA